MSAEDDRKHQDEAVDQICRAMRRARANGGTEAELQFDRLLEQWPELAQGLSKLLQAKGVMRPPQWRGIYRPVSGWPWAS